jgi:molybdopterin-guanine dinucleotide biosynthesis protein A
VSDDLVNGSIAAIILAGGQSSRFGTNKGLYDFQGQPLILRMIGIISGIARRIVVSVAPGQSQSFRDVLDDTVEIVEDAEPFLGPLIGLKNALKAISEEYVLLAPCDMPFLKGELYKFLLGRIGDLDAAILVLNGYFEPIIGLYRSDALRKAVDAVSQKGGKKLTDILGDLTVTAVNEGELRAVGIDRTSFLNLNTQL